MEAELPKVDCATGYVFQEILKIKDKPVVTVVAAVEWCTMKKITSNMNDTLSIMMFPLHLNQKTLNMRNLCFPPSLFEIIQML